MITLLRASANFRNYFVFFFQRQDERSWWNALNAQKWAATDLGRQKVNWWCTLQTFWDSDNASKQQIKTNAMSDLPFRNVNWFDASARHLKCDCCMWVSWRCANPSHVRNHHHLRSFRRRHWISNSNNKRNVYSCLWSCPPICTKSFETCRNSLLILHSWHFFY